ncbi:MULTISPECIES: hypothetical protein [unclassified Nonomuraea]|uniref:hypothetical protein n=1 Tax=unclassified Nonomuraea TaxID=2593643 RepID=UPI0034069A8B
MTDPHVSITLTFRTPAASAIVLEHVLYAINKSGSIPYELTGANCHGFDLDEVDEADEVEDP